VSDFYPRGQNFGAVHLKPCVGVLSVASIGENSVTLIWTNRDACQTADCGWNIYAATASEDYDLGTPTLVNDPGVLTATVDGLDSGIEYSFSVQGIGCGGGGFGQLSNEVNATPVLSRVLIWDESAIIGNVTLSPDDLLATSIAPLAGNTTFRNYDTSTEPNITGLLVYAEQVLYPPFTQSDSPNVSSLVGVAANDDSQHLLEFISSNGNWQFHGEATNFSDTQDTGLACTQDTTVFMFLVDMVNLQFYAGINGQWWDTETEVFVSTYQETTPLDFDASDTQYPSLYMNESAAFF